MTPLAELGFQIAPEDWAAMVAYQVQQAPLVAHAHRKALRGTIFSGVIAVAILAAFGYLITKDPIHGMWRAAYFATIMVIIWVLYAWTTLSRRAFVARYEQGVRRMMPRMPLSHFSVRLYEDRVEWTLGEGTTTHPWTPDSRVERASDAVFVHIGDAALFRVPRRAAKTEQEWDLFVTTAERLARAHAISR